LPGPIYLKIFILIVVLIQKFLLARNIIKNIFNIFSCLFIKRCLLFILHLRYSILYINRNVLILIIGQKDIVLNCNILVFKSHDHIMKLQLDMLQYQLFFQNLIPVFELGHVVDLRLLRELIKVNLRKLIV
jgi:hypothetical protein